MQRQNYMITAEEVAESMGISLGYAYKLLRKLNKELADQGYVTVAGKIPRAFWEKKFYGYFGNLFPGCTVIGRRTGRNRVGW
jgi:hypothetical protein